MPSQTTDLPGNGPSSPYDEAMHEPSAPAVTSSASGMLQTVHRNHVLTQSDMEARASASRTDGTSEPSILRVVPLLRVSGQKGHRVVLVGHSRLAVQSAEHVAVESFVTNVWVEGLGQGEFIRVEIDAAATNPDVMVGSTWKCASSWMPSPTPRASVNQYRACPRARRLCHIQSAGNVRRAPLRDSDPGPPGLDQVGEGQSSVNADEFGVVAGFGRVHLGCCQLLPRDNQ